MSPVKRKKRGEIKIIVGPFRNRADYETSMEIQREVWHCSDIDIVPANFMTVAEKQGGIALGAYNSLGEMIGFCWSILGVDGGNLLQHSCMLGVRAAYRNFEVGTRLKAAQRKEALHRKQRTITFAFDPMQPLHNYFYLGKLAASVAAYQENYYAESAISASSGLPLDRMIAHWNLESPSVEERLEMGPPKHDLKKELKKYPIINQLEEIAPGMATSSSLQLHLTADRLLFEIPYNLPDIKTRNLGVALEWQGKMRQVFRIYFKQGYVATDFWLAEEEGHLRAFFFLEKRKASA
jgi:predicted GNAT superfamily acetyltransferase